MHRGAENYNTINSKPQKISEYLSSLSVNLIIGPYPHVVQPVTYINDTLVIYSLGNFILNPLVTDKQNGVINNSRNVYSIKRRKNNLWKHI